MAMSPADRQAEAIADVERIWGAFIVEMQRSGSTRGAIENLLKRDVIRVGKRPNVERPMEGQTTIDDEISHLTDEDKAVGADGK